METISNAFLFQEVVSVLAAGMNVRFRLVGQSMLPFLRQETDILTVGPKQFYEIRVGDVVLASYQGSYVLHRIVAIKNDGTYLLRGDAHFKKSEQVAGRDIVGILASIERGESMIACYNGCAWRAKGLIWIKTTRLRMLLLKMVRVADRIIKRINS